MTRRTTVQADDLAAFGRAVLVAVGAREEDAAEVIETLIDADLRGLDSHGLIARLPSYADRVRDGGIDPDAEVRVIADHGALVVLDAAGGWGQVAALEATRRVVERARAFGIGAVGVRHSNHLGAVGYYGRKIAEAGLVGIGVSGAGPRIAPWGGAEALLATNPFTISAPSSGGSPLIIDVSGGAVLTGVIDRAARSGESIPEGWAIDEDGASTTDPVVALGGSLLPFGGAKGGALILGLEVLASVLTGANYSKHVPDLTKSAASQGLGHLFIALAPDHFGPSDQFERNVAELLGWVRDNRPVEGGPPVRVPGDRGEVVRARRLVEGIPLAGAPRAALDELGARTGVKWA